MAALAAPAPGLLLGYAADLVVADPLRAHPVAGFGQAAARLEGALYADSRRRGAFFVAVCVGVVSGSSWLLVRTVNTGGPGAIGRPASGRANARGLAALTAVATWSVVGGESLARVATRLRHRLADGDIEGARALLPSLCGRDPNALDAAGLARAAVESVAENTCDAVVGAAVWGGLAGVPGLLGYRAVNTLDAMVGHRSPRYERFGWAAARLDDLANYVPARLTALLAALPRRRRRPPRGGAAGVRRDGPRHPSPNAGRCEAAFAGALGVRLGGRNVYGGRAEDRPVLGDGPRPSAADIAARRAAVRRAVGPSALVVVVAVRPRSAPCGRQR